MKLPFIIFAIAAFVVIACATLHPTVNNIEKHGATYAACAETVMKDAIIASGTIVAQTMSAGVPPEVTGNILAIVARKEIQALQVCAEGGTPEKLWSPATETPDAGSSPDVGGTLSESDLPTKRF